ncbi:TPA: aldose 1-epimerase family protein [Salmonella enterica]|nr:aldose 1-epimerase family protein [Salmonella enterica]HCC0890865.1 aldose 1-epimerase family protein [Salmonella enterica]
MEWCLENARFRMVVRETGAELTLLWDKHRQRNWMWQPQPGVWNNSATQLFPVVGQLVHGGLWQDARFFPLSAHGFLRRQTFRCLTHDAAHLRLEVSDNDVTREVWPFKWRIYLDWLLEDEGLNVTWTVLNEDPQAWGYSLGWHPGFALPIASEPGWQVRFNPPCQGPFPTVNRTLEIPEASATLTVFKLQPQAFTDGAVYFASGEESQWAVCSPQGHEQIVFSASSPWLALWGVPGADLLCVEALSGTTDDPHFDGQVAHKRGIQWLRSGERHRHSLSVRFPADTGP